MPRIDQPDIDNDVTSDQQAMQSLARNRPCANFYPRPSALSALIRSFCSFGGISNSPETVDSRHRANKLQMEADATDRRG